MQRGTSFARSWSNFEYSLSASESIRHVRFLSALQIDQIATNKTRWPFQRMLVFASHSRHISARRKCSSCEHIICDQQQKTSDDKRIANLIWSKKKKLKLLYAIPSTPPHPAIHNGNLSTIDDQKYCRHQKAKSIQLPIVVYILIANIHIEPRTIHGQRYNRTIMALERVENRSVPHFEIINSIFDINVLRLSLCLSHFHFHSIPFDVPDTAYMIPRLHA